VAIGLRKSFPTHVNSAADIDKRITDALMPEHFERSGSRSECYAYRPRVTSRPHQDRASWRSPTAGRRVRPLSRAGYWNRSQSTSSHTAVAVGRGNA
jgi:hypothetical protein